MQARGRERKTERERESPAGFLPSTEPDQLQGLVPRPRDLDPTRNH